VICFKSETLSYLRIQLKMRVAFILAKTNLKKEHSNENNKLYSPNKELPPLLLKALFEKKNIY